MTLVVTYIGTDNNVMVLCLSCLHSPKPGARHLKPLFQCLSEAAHAGADPGLVDGRVTEHEAAAAV